MILLRPLRGLHEGYLDQISQMREFVDQSLRLQSFERCRNHFGRLLVMGLTINLFLYLFINAAMVMGLIPVVGVPLPLISYGGTAMITVMMGFGLIMAVHINEHLRVGRVGVGDEL